MEKKQTAVEFLGLELNMIFNDTTPELWEEVELKFQQAKQMEKKQIMEAVYDAMGTNFDPNMGRAEMYYEQKYGGNNNE
jgi:hypothetical protein